MCEVQIRGWLSLNGGCPVIWYLTTRLSLPLSLLAMDCFSISTAIISGNLPICLLMPTRSSSPSNGGFSVVRPPDCSVADLRSSLTSSLAWLSSCGRVAMSLDCMALSRVGGRYMSMEPLL